MNTALFDLRGQAKWAVEIGSHSDLDDRFNKLIQWLEDNEDSDYIWDFNSQILEESKYLGWDAEEPLMWFSDQNMDDIKIITIDQFLECLNNDINKTSEHEEGEINKNITVKTKIVTKHKVCKISIEIPEEADEDFINTLFDQFVTAYFKKINEIPFSDGKVSIDNIELITKPI